MTPVSPASSRRVQGVAAAAGLIAVVTLASRVVGFGRTLVFSSAVGTTCVGSVYQTANTMPNVVYEVAAGGALAAVAVPIIAGQLGRGDREHADRTASAMLTWALTLLLPLSLLVALLAAPITSAFLGARSCAGHAGAAADLGAGMLVVFAPQVALYGVGVVLAGVLQAHRRFLAAALAPLLSSLVVIAAYVLYAPLSRGLGNDPARLPDSAAYVLSVGTTLGVVALSLPLLWPVRRAGVRLRLTWRFPAGVARRAASLAGAGVLALVAQEVAVVATTWVANNRSSHGTINVYTYVQAVYLLPYAVLAVPVAISTFPHLAAQTAAATVGGQEPGHRAATTSVSGAGSTTGSAAGGTTGSDGVEAGDIVAGTGWAEQAGAPQDAARTLARSARAISVVAFLGASVLLAVAGPVGAFFGVIDQGRHDPVGRAVLTAMPVAMASYAPGLVGFGMAALLTRALYVRGRPRVAAGAVALGWLVAAVWPLLALTRASSPEETLRTLGEASSVGMTLSAVLLLVSVRRAWGPHALHGLPRTLGAALLAAVVAAVPARLIAGYLPTSGLVPAVLTGIAAAALAVVLFVAVLSLADRETGRVLGSRLRRRAT